jgi:hypothetical protein
LGVGLLVAGAATGCRSRPVDYHVQLRNETSGALRALVIRETEGRIFPVIDKTVYPKDRAELSIPMRPAREELVLQVDAPNNPAAPAKMQLAPGQTIIMVTRQGDDGPFSLELLKGR